MSAKHSVQQGETCAHIAAQYGVPAKTVWNHASNKTLKDLRSNPNVLFPGDTLNIPDLDTPQLQAPTDNRHRFRRLGVPLILRLELRDGSGAPLAGCDCELLLGDQTLNLTTDGQGRLDATLPLAARQGELKVRGTSMALLVGHLDPVDELSGWRERLNNLGYHAGSCDDEVCEQRRYALEEFQCDHGLTVDGICGPKTRARLVEIHGC
jgi:hypothetical protein